jgi:predicted enzyme related to lactoylglutathione lyase
MTMKTRQLVPMASVANVERSIAFYAHLGFEVGNTFAPQGATTLSWAWIQSGDAQFMLSKASQQVPDQHSVLFYIYTDDVAAAHASLAAAGLNPGEIKSPFYAPRGEFELVDPDGYILMITHT